MKIAIEELKSKLTVYLINKGFSAHQAQIITEPFIKAELMRKKTHGISKFLLLDEPISKREGAPEIIKEKHNYALINANKELGYLSADFACDVLIAKAKEFDNATVGVINSYYFAMAGVYAEKIARAGFIGIILNNGGPAAVAPFGGIDPILGTNPIAIGIPTDTDPIVLDIATSEQPWGEINLAKVENRPLRGNAFIDKDGKHTSDPTTAEAIVPFGNNHKGYGLNLMTEILTGAFVGAQMGLQAHNAYDLGFLFTAYSPSMFTSETNFKTSVQKLVREIKQSRKAKNVEHIYLPGEKSMETYKKVLADGRIEISEETWQTLNAFVDGTNIRKSKNIKE